jgi:serine phosphatase RsbU (regulator of sigma subunit)
VFPTDGILDAESTAGEKYGIDRLHAAVLATRSLDTQACLDAIFAEVEEFARGGGPQFDDMTLVVLDVTSGAEPV